MSRALDLVLILFIGALGLNWPDLPGNARLPELLFIPLLLLTMAEWVGSREIRFRSATLDLLVVGYLAGSLPSLMATDDVRASVVELGRHAYLAAIYVVVAALVLMRRAGLVARGFRASALLHVATGVVAAVVFRFGMPMPAVIGEVMKMPYVGEVLRLRALTFSPSMLGALLTATIPFVLVSTLSGDGTRRRRWMMAAAAGGVAVLLTFSHTVAGFLAAAVFVVWPVLSLRRPLRLIAATAVVGIAAFFNLTLTASVRAVSYGQDRATDSTVYPYAVDKGQAALGPARVDYEVMSYFRIKQLALEAFAAHPLTGVGLDRFHRVSEAGYQAGRLPRGYREIDPHSALPGRLAETGIVGGITLLALWWGAAVAGRRALARSDAPPWLARAAVAAFLGLLVNSINIDIMNFRFFWAGLGLLRGLSSDRQPGGDA